jgi:hypothetical protein
VPSGRNRWRLQDYVTAGGPVLIRELASGPPVVQRVGEFVGVDAFGLSRHGEDDWPQVTLSDGKVVGVEITATALGCSAQWVRELCSRGTFPGAYLARGSGRVRWLIRWLIPLAALHTYRAAREVA